MNTGDGAQVWRGFIVALLLCSFVIRSEGQTNGQVPGSATRPMGSSLDKLFEQGAQQTGYIPLQPFEETVDESQYIVGPNDVFNFQVPGTELVVAYVFVSPEGKLVIPNGGEYQASGKTLKQLKQEVLNSFKAVKPSLTLFSPRQFVVTVLGAVEKPGPYVMTAVLRVDKVLALAGKPPEGTAVKNMAGRPFSTRRIILRRKGVPDLTVDLDRFYAFRQNEDDPFLREGDIIIVPPRSIDQASVSVYGAVNAPDQYEYRPGDSLAEILKIAQGLTPNADSSDVEITRLSLDASKMETRSVDVGPILRGEASDIPLANKDRIVVREKFDRRLDYKVHVRGEIKYPGMYPITPERTRLSEIIERAGGFTARANLPMAEITRKQETPEGNPVDFGRESLRNLRMNDQLVTPEEKAYYDLESNLRAGMVPADFIALFEQHDTTKDILLRDGDIIFVPDSQKTVYVYGQVGQPGYVPYRQGADLRYYVEKAGGYGDEAESGDVRVIKRKSREWMNPSDTTIEPGDYIWVPRNIHYPTGYYLNLVSQAASFVSVVLSMTVIIIQLSK